MNDSKNLVVARVFSLARAFAAIQAALWVAGAAAQDLAPASVSETIYAVIYTAPPLPFVGPYPHSAVLSSDGSRTPINFTGAKAAYGPASYTWTKTSTTTGTLSLPVVTPGSRLEITFTAIDRGTFREFTSDGSLFAEGKITFSPLPSDPTPPLLNLSSRTNIGPNLMATLGFSVSGSVARRILVRAVGPALVQFGVANPAASPSLAILGTKGQIAANSGWGGSASVAAVFATVGAFALPTNSKDAALVLSLEPGNYTAQVRSDTAGEVLVEVYFVD